ncbi:MULTISPECIES: 1-deoxy-D-xylulose-5-phosphate reductoisomerase [Psychrobacter]|uniref:1-deoxy-D-xylulose 5-phosphate reductoisomerase n=1 Tax=Psychrobacter pocilloporae TaxID=1775882 RepID=A0ABT6IT31_9GAMM|nr:MULTISPECIES: 1-deoxy-D-xylulose-5-phosphate reductoisomerase [Psychrobacter]MBZ1392254.1 1-deoxy-D-xylulose-5-phosphate reductoisomerase [Psychrobacter pacificensis]MDE0844165.1 1-deoxy-D-xylulose-5-phosphate reductoisomerase [Psychrobacter pacificensis]MDH4904377.1 1-deoxy-D-xylulose-5-phosphate reductoisomerase [Psychrobacter pocilloporae]MED6318330.1 1-deoxy-D-xylulose-5-phosphate reductoisomerase [Pseudomonadota bacterium]
MVMTQRIAVLGATGSIGDSTLAILAAQPQHYEVYALSGYHRLDKLFALCQQFLPKRVSVPTAAVDDFAKKLKAAGIDSDVVGGEEGLVDIATDSQTDTVVAAIVGAAGLPSTLAAARAGKRILLANKEALVMAGQVMINAVKTHNATLLPLDSEHNAIFQCLPLAIQQDNTQIHQPNHGVRKLWLTASGGPFLQQSFEQMQQATVAEAVKHPNWSMGQKISVDSATMMNKGLELIEACHLFDLPENKINVVIHPQSIIHSMVEYSDGSFLAQLGSPDMKTPIAHALSYPSRIDSGSQPLDLYALSGLEFIEPDLQKFACLRLARQAMQAGTQATIVLNAANEIAVAAFLDGQIRLTDIADINERALNDIQLPPLNETADIEDILAIDKIARHLTDKLVAKLA